MSDKVVIPCPHCDAVNRLPAERRGDGAKFGKCGKPLFTGEPIVLDERRFARHAGAEDPPLPVDFRAPWCGPCRAMAPTFGAAAKEFEARLRLARIDSDTAPGLAARNNIRTIPTLVLFRRGREVARQSGAMPEGELRRCRRRRRRSR